MRNRVLTLRRQERNLRSDTNVPYLYCASGGYINVYICQNSLNCTFKKAELGNSLVVQWLGLNFHCHPGSIPGCGTKIPQASWQGPKEKNGRTFLCESYIHRNVLDLKKIKVMWLILNLLSAVTKYW